MSGAQSKFSRAESDYISRTLFRLLESAVAQNQRNRYLLQRIAGGIKEYEAVQLKMSKALGLTHDPLPVELTEAFSHDPSVVTGSTRQKRGWQAVEDIHDNIIRQRNTIQAYLQQPGHAEITPPASVLDSPLKSLQQSLDALEHRRGLISQKVQEVTETLERTKKLHVSVKTEYNNTVSHTSSVYPEVRPTNTLSWTCAEHSLSCLKSLPWRRDTKIAISSYGKLAWMRLQSSWIP
jgi:hypothetical protein